MPAEVRQLNVRLPRELHRRVRIAALEAGISLQEWVARALRAHLARRPKEERLHELLRPLVTRRARRPRTSGQEAP